MAKVGRPPKFTDLEIDVLVEDFERYIEETDLPSVAGFAAKHRLGKDYINDRREFSELKRWLHSKREAALEIGGLTGVYDKTVTVFALKQKEMGWSDKTITEHEGTLGITQIEFVSPSRRHEVTDDSEDSEYLEDSRN
jgi:hypothetical protein